MPVILNAVPFVALPTLWLASRDDNDLAVRIHLDARHRLPGSDDGLDCSSKICLAEYGRSTRHHSYSETRLSAFNAVDVYVGGLPSAARTSYIKSTCSGL